MGIWEEEDNIAIDSDTPCDIYIDMTRTVLANKKDGASKDKMALEPMLELSSDETRDVEVVEAEVVDFIDDYENN